MNDRDVLPLVEQYLRAVSAKVLDMAARGQGRDVLGAVPGRPVAEDLELGIDRACDDLLDDWCRSSGLRVRVHSEHGVREPVQGKGWPEYVITIDPFDGTGLFKRGLPAEWWCVLSVLRADGLAPLAGGAVDILRGEAYFADQTGMTLLHLADSKRRTVQPSRMTSLAQGPTIAAFLMNPGYLRAWTSQSVRLLDTLVARHPDVRLWPNGGSCIYPWMARGLVQAYVMFDEPRSEIDPGIAFAHFAGLPLFRVSRNGSLSPYTLDLATEGGREPFFIAACTEALAAEIARTITGSG